MFTLKVFDSVLVWQQGEDKSKVFLSKGEVNVFWPQLHCLGVSSCLVWKVINMSESLFFSISLHTCHLFLHHPPTPPHLSNIHPSSVFPQKSSGRGELLLSLCYQSTTNTLTVVVLKARHLPKTENNGPTGTCSLSWTFPLLPHRHRCMCTWTFFP